MDLRANTAVDILVGPILDSVAATEEAGETIARADVLLSKLGQALTQKTETTACAFDDHGCYNCMLDATDTNAPGILTVVIFMAGTMIYRADYDVLSEQAYDAKYKGQGGFIGQVAALAADTPSAGIMRVTLADPGLSSATNDQMIGNILNIIDRSTRAVLGSRVIGAWTDASNYAFVDDFDFTPTTAMDYQVLWCPPGSASYAPEVGLTTAALADVQDEVDTSLITNGIQSILEDTAEIGTAGAGLTALGGMSTTMKAQVNTEVVDVLGTDTLAEMAQGIPPAAPTFKQAVMYLYMRLRNKLTVTSSELAIYNDAGTKIAKKTVSDDGTTYTEAEMISGA